MPDLSEPVINAAGKLTALGGSALSTDVAESMAFAAGLHFDLKQLRARVAEQISRLCIAEAACITSGAAAGITICCAALLTGSDLLKVRALPSHNTPRHRILLQAGHQVDFGAPIEQMIRLSGAEPLVFGSVNSVRPETLQSLLSGEKEIAALLYVQSHHCVQENMISLEQAIDLCHRQDVPVIVDAAAEEDLTRYTAAGADLTIYSGGKALCGPTSGFIVGRQPLIEACELQFAGIARTMKAGKEQIAGLSAALTEYDSQPAGQRNKHLDNKNQQLLEAWQGIKAGRVYLKPDEAGRGFDRVAVSPVNTPPQALLAHLEAHRPSIRTRNHHLDEGIILFDTRELTTDQCTIIASAVLQFFASTP